MARTILTGAFGALLLVAGCADAPELHVDAPLFVFNSYPSNGATVARADLQELAVVFSAPLGAEDRARAQARYVRLEGPDGEIGLLRADDTNVSYDPDDWMLRVELDPPAQAALGPGEWRLVVARELTDEEGRPLPRDFAVRFFVVE